MSVVGLSPKLLASMVALVPVYWTILQTRDILTPEGYKLVMSPGVIFVIAFGSSYAATGDTMSTVRAISLASALYYYAFVMEPEVGKKYFRGGL